MKNLQQDIRTGVFKPVYLLYGEERYLLQLYKNKLRAAILAPEDTMNLTVFEGKNCDVREIIAQADTMPFFADHRLILIEQSGFFENANPELSDYLNRMPAETIIVFVESKVDKRGKLYKTVSKLGLCTEMKRQDEKTLTAWILGTLKRENKAIQKSTLDLFLTDTGDDMEHISTELEKLLCYTAGRQEIRRQDVLDICSVQTEGKIFDMIHAVAEKRQKEALDLYYDLLAQKEPALRILFLAARQFNQLYQVKDLTERGLHREEIAGRMGVQSFIIRRSLGQAALFEKETLKQAVEDCVQAETDVKTGLLADRIAVEMLLVKYSSREKKQEIKNS